MGFVMSYLFTLASVLFSKIAKKVTSERCSCYFI